MSKVYYFGYDYDLKLRFRLSTLIDELNLKVQYRYICCEKIILVFLYTPYIL